MQRVLLVVGIASLASTWTWANVTYAESDESWIETCLLRQIAGSDDLKVCANLTRQVVPEERWEGLDSQVHRYRLAQITNTSDWEALWQWHRGRGSPVPWVDFRINQVLCLFVPGSQGDGPIKAMFIDRFDKLVAYFAYHPGTPPAGEARGEQHAFVIYVLPKTREQLVIRTRRPGPESDNGFVTTIQYAVPKIPW